LLQYNVVTRFQSAPATVLLLVLGGGCGLVGRSAVDSLGGDGRLWQRLWVAYVGGAALTTWCARGVRVALDRAGPPGRIVFHLALAAALPFLVGAFPFEDVFAAFALEAKQRAAVMVSMAAEGAESAAEIIGFGFIYAGN